MYCINCGNILGENDTICDKCGCKIDLLEQPIQSSEESIKNDERATNFLDTIKKYIVNILFVVLAVVLVALFVQGPAKDKGSNSNELENVIPTTNVETTLYSELSDNSYSETTSEITEYITETTASIERRLPCDLCGRLIEENIFAGNNICNNCIENYTWKLESCKENEVYKYSQEDSIFWNSCYHCAKHYACKFQPCDDPNKQVLYYSVCPWCSYRNVLICDNM